MQKLKIMVMLVNGGIKLYDLGKPHSHARNDYKRTGKLYVGGGEQQVHGAEN